MPKVSIILPIYNVEKYLSRCIESILNQTFTDLELILINDGSTDRCGEICDLYNKKDTRVNVIHKENGGVSSARNVGIDVAKGEFIGFIDPDDYIDEDAIEYLYKLAKENKADISCYKMKTYKNGVLVSNLNKAEEIKIYVGEEIIKEYVQNGTFLYSTCNKLYSKKLLQNEYSRFPTNIRYAEDALFNYYMLAKSCKLVFSNQQKYNYYINSGSVVSNITEKRLDILKAQKEMFYFLKNRYGKYTNYIVRQYIRSSIMIVQDIAIKNNIFEKRSILNNLKAIVIRDKDILTDIRDISLKDKIYFSMLRVSPKLLCILYRIKFLISSYAINKCRC